jgi:demethylmenaquinone methyltransferase/2-methoxy-6-polyprenyl-1,4-benzoquinol methylase
MSTYILMKILESAPARFDLGIRLLTLGQIDHAYDRLASHIEQGWKVLDIGCGTGALSILAAQRGAQIKGIDTNPAMIEVAMKKIHDAGLDKHVAFAEKGIAELDEEPAEEYDAVMSGLCFSELSDEELRFALVQIKRMLKPAGMLLIADETVPGNMLKRIVSSLLRLPLAALTYAVAQTVTRAIKNLPRRIESAGFVIKLCNSNVMDTFVEIIAIKPINSVIPGNEETRNLKAIDDKR